MCDELLKIEQAKKWLDEQIEKGAMTFEQFRREFYDEQDRVRAEVEGDDELLRTRGGDEQDGHPEPA
jgi:predicted  nucleic acid-binding Zn-ribbon protein